MPDNESTFRAAAAVVLLLIAPIGIYHRLRARRLGTKLRRRQESLATLIPLKLCGLTALAFMAAWLARPALVGWGHVPLPAWLRWLGAAMCLSAAPLLWWTFHTLGHNLTDTVATRDNSYLVTAGPYRWVRHPFYVIVLTCMTGFTLLCAQWPFAAGAGVVFALLAARTPLEERKLVERFGDAYVEYAERTGRFIPRLSHREQKRITTDHSG